MEIKNYEDKKSSSLIRIDKIDLFGQSLFL